MQRLKWRYHKNAAGALYKQQMSHTYAVTATVTVTTDAGKLSWDITTTQVNSALHPYEVAKSSTTFG